MLRYIQEDCSGVFRNHYEILTLEVDSESGMIQLLKQNKVHIAVPIFEQQNSEKYSEFIFFKLVDYPGTEYVTLGDDENDALDVVFDSVLKSWPLLAVTMIFTAIAGNIMWALVRLRSQLQLSSEINLNAWLQHQNAHTYPFILTSQSLLRNFRGFLD